MTEVLSKEGVQARLSELRGYMDEANRLERILEVWDAPKERSRRTSATANRSSHRARRGSRPQEFMDAVKDSPGISAADLATEMECNVNYVYRIASDLIDEGKIVKSGKGFFPAEHAPQDEHDEPTAEADEDFDEESGDEEE